MTTANAKPHRTAEARTFGDRLYEAAKDKGAPMEQERLAEWFLKQHGIETTGAMLNKYKNRDAIPRMDKCRQFALALDVTIEWLYTGRGPKRPPPAMDENDEEVIRRLHEIDDLGERTDWYGYLKIALKRDTPPPPTGE